MSNWGLINPSLFSFFTPQQQSLSLGNDTILCYSDSLSINLTKECSTTFLWQNLSTDSFFIITQPGTYWVQVSNSCFTFSDTILVDFSTSPVIDLGNNTTLCQGNVMFLDATTIKASYLWQNNSTNPT